MSPNKIPTRATITQLARTGGGITELSDPAVRRHISQHNLKKGKDGKYHTKAVLNAIIEDQKRDARHIGGDGSGAVQKVKVTKIALECQILQVKLSHLKGELHSVADCNAEWDRAGVALRGAIDSWQQHATAKRPKAKALIDELYDSLLAVLEVLK